MTMKILNITSAAALALAAMTAPSFANEVEESCEEFTEEYETGYEGCTCLGEKADADADLEEAILSIETPEDLEEADDFVLEAIEACR